MSRHSAARVFLFVVTLFFLKTNIAAQQRGNPAPPGPPPKLTKVQDDLYLIENQGGLADIGPYGGNITIYITNEGIILVDSKNERIHDDVLAKVKAVSNQPIKYVILTHNHGDHAAGAP